MTQWTSIVTASTSYVQVTTPSSRIYDDVNITFDDPNTFYNSIDSPWASIASNSTTWTSVIS